MKILAYVWLCILLAIALVVLVAPFLPAIPEEGEEHGR